MLLGLSTLLISFAVISDGHQRRFLFGTQGGTTLESVLPDECTYLSEFEDVLSIANKWIKNGEYLYSELLRIRIRELRHVPLDNIENGYRYLLDHWKGNKSSEFHEAILSIEYVNQFHHSICLSMLEYLLNTFLKQHQGNVCTQYLRLPRNELGPNPVQCSTAQAAITTKLPLTTQEITMITTEPTTTPITHTPKPKTSTPKPTTTPKPLTTTPKPTTTQKPTTTSKPTTTTSKPTTTSSKSLTSTQKPTTTPNPTLPPSKSTEAPTSASTLTTMRTTIPTTPNPNLSCAICNDTDCKNDESDLQYCTSLDDYCLISLLDDVNSRKISRRCANKSFCLQDLTNNGGYKPFCYMAEDGAFGFNYECNFCCTSSKCNLGPQLVPNENTIFHGV